MTSYFRRPGLGLSISPAAKAADIGQSITVRVTAAARRDTEIRQARAWLAASIWSRENPMVVANNMVVSRQPPPATVTATGAALGLAGHLAAGDQAACEAVLPNWASAPTGGAAGGRRLEYGVFAAADLADGRTVIGRSPVTIVSGRSAYQEIEDREPPPSPPGRNCDLRLVLPVRHGRPGETLRGVLCVTPRHPVRARRVAVLLWCVLSVTRAKLPPSVPYAEYRRRDVPLPAARGRRPSRQTLAKRVDLPEPREFPFTVRLPAKASPTLITGYLSVRWYVRGLVQYDMLRAEGCSREVNVYNSPG